MKQRFRNLLNYAVGCIRRYRIRTAVILICLIVAAAVFASVGFVKDGLVKEGQLSLVNAPDITVQGMWGGRPTFVDYGDWVIFKRLQALWLLNPEFGVTET
jgi:hypothetical protein